MAIFSKDSPCLSVVALQGNLEALSVVKYEGREDIMT